jgi:hypothetical protein
VLGNGIQLRAVPVPSHARPLAHPAHYKGERVALHARGGHRGRHTTVPEHIAELAPALRRAERRRVAVPGSAQAVPLNDGQLSPVGAFQDAIYVHRALAIILRQLGFCHWG